MDELAIPYLKQEQPDMAIMEAYKSFYNEIAAEYGWDGEVAPVTVPTRRVTRILGYHFQSSFSSLFILFSASFEMAEAEAEVVRTLRRRGRGPIFFPGSFGGGSGGGFRRRWRLRWRWFRRRRRSWPQMVNEE